MIEQAVEIKCHRSAPLCAGERSVGYVLRGSAKNMSHRILITVCLAQLAGCVTPGVWYNANKTQEQAEMDGYQCRADGEQYAANLGFNGNPLIVADRFRDCMKVRGYVWQTGKNDPQKESTL